MCSSKKCILLYFLEIRNTGYLINMFYGHFFIVFKHYIFILLEVSIVKKIWRKAEFSI